MNKHSKQLPYRTYFYSMLLIVFFICSFIWRVDIYEATLALINEEELLAFANEPIKDSQPAQEYMKAIRLEEEINERIEMERLAEEQRLEEERLAEEQRLEEERLAKARAEEAARQAEQEEADRLARAEAEALIEEERIAAEQAVQVSSQVDDVDTVDSKEDSVAQTPPEETAVSEPKPESKPEPQSNPVSSGHLLGTFQATAYAVGDGLTPSTVTANGTNVANTIYTPDGHRIIAADTSVLPMNSIVRIEVPGWAPFTAKISDTGSAINGHIIDILMASPQEALSFGRQNGIKIYLIH